MQHPSFGDDIVFDDQVEGADRAIDELGLERARAVEALLLEWAERDRFGRVLKAQADAVAVKREMNARAAWEEAVRS
jgi:hypothetical protein